jgi:hypothetical protein
VANSPYRNAGTTNIDPAMLADLASKTTYPPVVLANTNFTSDLVLGPQATRESPASPDLGYAYVPLDYVVGGCDLCTNLTFTAGTAVGYYFDYGQGDFGGLPYGIALDDGAVLTFSGTATAPCYMVPFALVQEGDGNWLNYGYMAAIVLNGSGQQPYPVWTAQFTKGITITPWGFEGDNGNPGVGRLSDCEFYIFAGFGSYDPSFYVTNCLFWRVCNGISGGGPDVAALTLQNCTFFNGGLVLTRYGWENPAVWTIINTTFDGTAFLTADDWNGDPSWTQFDHNAYNTNNTSWTGYEFWTQSGTLETPGPHDVQTGSYNWQSSWFGNFYLPPDSALFHAGNPTADQVGLFHFTTQTNQAPEETNRVSIGYHYVATDANGNPLDTNGDGIPDYIEDANGDGLYDPGDAGNWLISGYNGLSPTSGLSVFTPLK